MPDNIQPIIEQARTAYQDEDFSIAAGLFKSAQELFEASGDRLNAAEMANNRSVALLKAGDAAGALQAVQDSDGIFAQAGDVKRQAMALANTAAALEGLKKWSDALDLYEQSSELLKGAGEKELRAYVLKSISAIQLRQGNRLEAIATMDASLDNKPNPGAQDRFVKRLIQWVYKLLGR
jgi:tetratricopeptide (TPR) repeat protein